MKRLEKSRVYLLPLFLVVGVLGGYSLKAQPSVGLFEDFRVNPLTHGWKIFGETNLFAWNSTSQNLEVTWDSSRPNSYFYKRLDRVLSRNNDDSFSFYFSLRLRDIAIGTTTNKPYTFQIAVGLLNFQQATNAGFLRGTGFNSPNIFEFNYFPDSGFGATISPTVISSNHQFATSFILKEVTTNDVYQIGMVLGDGGGRITTIVQRNGDPYASDVFFFPTNFTDFDVDTIAIASYSDEGQFPDFAGSILAHGTVDNLYVSTGNFVAVDLAFTGRFENGNWRMDFDTQPGWVYTAGRMDQVFGGGTSFDVGSLTGTNYGRGTIIHTNPITSRPQFYRLLAEFP